MAKLRFRQVHLDFHTSPLINGIGEEFNKNQFQRALQEGHVDSITVFSKCHHGYAYHPSKVHDMHPHLQFDLLGAQLDACKEIGVKAPVYISAGLDEKEAVKHPEWLVRNADETLTWVQDFTTEAGFHLLCYNTPYFELLLAQIEEVMQNYKPEGIFLDISSVHPCYCARCRQDILDRGKDIRDREAVIEQAELVFKKYGQEVKKLVHKYNTECTIFHNGGHITRGRRDIAGYNTHLELESLPTGGWGYDHFPMSASYAGSLGMEYLGMTGKFHNSWGEFGGFKHPNALRYETSLSLAFSAKCSIGDQLHPGGRMDQATYKLIGKAYQEVEQKELWCQDAVNLCDIAILGDEVINSRISDRDIKRYSDIGVNRMMLEGKYLYRFIDLEDEFKNYKLIILPDEIKLDSYLKKRLQEYLDQGGRILATGCSGLDPEEISFQLDFGAEYIKKGNYDPNYILPDFEFITGATPHVMYDGGYEIRMTTGEKLASHQNPYFNRDVHQFCSHQHTPYSNEAGNAAVSIANNTVYIGWKVFADYAKNGSLHLKELVVFCLEHLLKDEKRMEVALPDRGVATLTKQEGQNRYIQHLLFTHTTIRGEFILQGNQSNVEVIEDIVPVYNIVTMVRIEEKVKKVYLVPSMEPVSFTQIQNKVCYTVSKMECHQMVAIDY